MAIFKNEGKGISILLKTDYSQVQLKENENINIDEKLVLSYPKTIKKYSDEEWRKLNTPKVEEKKPTLVKEEPKSTEVETEKVEEKAPKKTTRRGRKSNKGITNA